MTFTITTLVENTVYMGPKGLKGEHGLSFLIQADDRKILFDTGQTGIFMDNAEILNADLSDVDTVVLSHGHYDHAGGLERFAEFRTDFTLAGHPDIFCKKQISALGSTRDIGMPVDRETLVAKGVRLSLTSGPAEIGPGIMSTGEVPMQTGFESIEPVFLTEKEGRTLPDPFTDDQALILDTVRGTVVILGCAHRGTANTLMHVAALTGKTKIHAIMGGLHLGGASGEKLKQIAAVIRNFDIRHIGVGHCTGHKAVAYLSHEFGDRVFPIGVGQSVKF
ncbi:MBL fold metallo-hydrolase [Desulfonema ishimotonii]|uniref:MBL fold metallo-hydrolase n=1 Tax=Desulfonema ishimotonii TaxID=45657 RepID=A0A401FTS1_9BACT|nr:MBL fold metallo-hydrolase [Desulfonema ishimotonii]GBC60361.1 MBL fold metallo-hydrolase [Desulfonema ishimotonii]